ncbi:MAG: endonuclease/exonuclease/phosphatase family protein [Candidatus Micrarchaeaceae archaeon]|jgi:exodeoxyribonuclease III
MVGTSNGRQTFLDAKDTIVNTPFDGQIKCLNWNIQNPSPQRAIKQINWIERSNFDVIILTEFKCSRAGLYIIDRLKSKGYVVKYPELDKDYGVLLAVSKDNAMDSKINKELLSNRISSIVYKAANEKLLLLGVYAPIWNTDKQRAFLEFFAKSIEDICSNEKYDKIIILGDMNMLEPNHTSKYQFLEEWRAFYKTLDKHVFVDAFRLIYPNKEEYSWFTNGRDHQIDQRIDHCFVSKNLTDCIKDCSYIHEVRLEKLSDHSAMCLEIKKD